MDTHTPRTPKLLLTLAAAVTLLVMIAGCGDTVLGPAGMPVATPQAAFTDLVPTAIVIEAVVTSITDPASRLQGAVAVGDSVNGTFRYDEDAVDIDVKSERGRYLFDAAPCGMDVAIAALRFQSDPVTPALAIRLDNAAPGDLKRDTARFSSTANLPVVPGIDVADMSILLTDKTAQSLESDVLAGTDPYHAAWPTKRQLTITGTAGWQIVAEVVTWSDPDVTDPPDHQGGNNKYEFHHE